MGSLVLADRNHLKSFINLWLDNHRFLIEPASGMKFWEYTLPHITEKFYILVLRLLVYDDAEQSELKWNNAYICRNKDNNNW